jgi:hypothetical protein
VWLEDPPGLSSITTVGRYPTVEEAQVATDEVWRMTPSRFGYATRSAVPRWGGPGGPSLAPRMPLATE